MMVLDDLGRVQVRAVGGGVAIAQHQYLEAMRSGTAHRGVDAKIGGTATENEPIDRLLGQQEGELGVEKAVTGRLAYPALSLGRLQRTVQLPTRGARFQFGAGGASHAGYR